MKIDDTTLHVWAGMIISFVAAMLLKYLGLHHAVAAALGLVIGVLVGLGKEFLWDKNLGKGTFNMNDYLATGWGAFVGAFIYFVGYLIVHGY